MGVVALMVVASEVALLLLLLHRAALIVVDQATLALGGPREEHLADDLRQRVGIALDRAAERVAAQRAEADLAQQRRLAGLERETAVVDHDQRAVALDDGSLLGEVQRND